MNINSRIVCILTILVLLISISVPNVVALVEKKSLKDLVKDSDSIITGKVIDKTSYDEKGNIFTDVTISTDMKLKGNSGSQIVVKVPGGAVGDRYDEVSDAPFFEKGEDVLLFSKGNAVVGWDQGKYTIKNNKIKENGLLLSEFVHNIKKELLVKPEKGKVGKDIDVVSEKLDISSAVQMPIYNSNGKIVIGSSTKDNALASIKTEGFEGAFPNTWAVSGTPTWCNTNFRFAVGSMSGWPACAGAGAVTPGGEYAANMDSRMVYGPFSLADATNALVTFKHWTDTEPDYDYFQVLASTDGSYWYGDQYSGDWTPWKDVTFDLTNVFTLGDLRGQPNVWIMFRFTSDNLFQYYGTFLDDINIQKDTTASTAPHITSVTPASGPVKAIQLGSSVAASDSTQVTIIGTNFGATAGSAKFWRIGTTVYDATIISWTDTQIVVKVPGRMSSYTKPDGSGNVQVVKSDSTPSDNYGNFRVTYSYGGGKWAGGNPTYRVNPNTADTADELTSIQAAANTWSAAGANFGFVYGGPSTKTSVAGDGENTILWGSTGGSIATTWTRWGADPNVILEDDIVFEDAYDWGSDGSLTKMDTETIGLHEFGHWLQLLDMYGSTDSEKVMYGYGSEGNIRRTLNTDDIDGIRAIYGSSASSITVTSPNGGGTWVRGMANTITWSSSGSPGANVRIDLLKGGAVVGTVVASTPNDGSYSWTISSTRAFGSDYRIRVSSTSTPTITDDSDSDFTIGGINVNVPNGGETWVRGTSHTITWSSSGSPGPNVKIELIQGAAVVGTVTAGTPNDGSYSWTISSTRALGSDYKIRVTSTTNAAYKDTSNSNFIIGGINVNVPNGGENWLRGAPHTITWSSLGSPGPNVKIELIKGVAVVGTVTAGTPNDGSHSWTISPSRAIGIDYKIRVTSTTNAAYKDTSNNNFRIS